MIKKPVQDLKLNENKINNLLDDVETDRRVFFEYLKNTNTNDTNSKIYIDINNKLKGLENIQRALLSYKRLMTKQDKNND